MQSRLSNAVLSCLALVLLAALPAQAERFGLADEFLLSGVNARSAGMGNAFVAMPDDAASLYWNPAGLGQIKTIEISMFHSFLVSDTYYDYLAYVQPILGLGKIGVGCLGLAAQNYLYPGAAAPAPYRDMQLLAGWGNEFLPGFYGGLDVKLQNTTLGPGSGSAVSADAGVMYRRPKSPLTLGLNVRNLGPYVIPLEGVNNEYPLLARAGGSLWVVRRLARVNLDVVYIAAGEGKTTFAAGVEAMPWPFLPIRAGYSEQAWSLGAGWASRDLHLDYALVYGADARLTHRVSLSLSLGTYQARLAVDPKNFSRHSLNKTCTFAITLPEVAPIKKWQLVIRNSDGRIVKRIRAKTIPNSLVWDGKNDKDQFLPEGLYRAELTGQDREGNVLRSNTVEVSILEPTVIKMSPEKEGTEAWPTPSPTTP